MPATPTVFRGIRSNDFQRRPFRAYKRYRLTNTTYSGSGAAFQQALYTSNRIDLFDTSVTYPTNSYDDSNQHVIWKWLDHRYYRYPYDPARSFELTDRGKNIKHLDISASIITLPYFNVGERVKPGSISISATPVNTTIVLNDDYNGNLRDPLIKTASFANDKRNVFYLSFNDKFRKFAYGLGTYDTSSIQYVLNKQERSDATIQNVELINGITAKNSAKTIGRAGKFTSNAFIRIPHNDIFNRFQTCDEWTISFWYKTENTLDEQATLISKIGEVTERKLITSNGQNVVRDVIKPISSLPAVHNGDWSSYRMPFYLGVRQAGSSERIYFRSSNGSRGTVISSSLLSPESWHHVAVRNSGSICKLYLNGIVSSNSSSLPNLTSNTSNILLGKGSTLVNNGVDVSMSEIRFYDYAASATEIASLSNNHFISASCLQTNVVGNTFYRNGQIVVSSPLPRYNSGSGYFGKTWSLSYQGQHTIYENEVLVRIPADQLNVSTNPSATYQPATVLNSACDTGDSPNNKLTPGEMRKPMFIDGTARPYITTIGLYNDTGELLVVGKLATPVQKRDDIDMSIIIRWDY